MESFVKDLGEVLYKIELAAEKQDEFIEVSLKFKFKASISTRLIILWKGSRQKHA